MPTINDLPSELLLEILSYLDGIDIRDCSESSKLLRAIAHHPTLDHKVFRSRDVRHEHNVIDMDDFVLNPLVVYAMFNKEMLLPEDPHIVMPECEDEFDQEHGLPVLHARGYKGNVTSPPVSCIILDGLIIKNEDKSAATVSQVSQELIRRNVEVYQHSDHFWHHYEIHALDWHHDPNWCGKENLKKYGKKKCKDIVMYTSWYS